MAIQQEKRTENGIKIDNMKITKRQLKQLIAEELESVLRDPSEDETLGTPDPKDIQILQAIKELLESSGRRVGTDGLARELQRLAEIVAKNPEFDVEEPEMSDDDPGFMLPTATAASVRGLKQKLKRPPGEWDKY